MKSTHAFLLCSLFFSLNALAQNKVWLESGAGIIGYNFDLKFNRGDDFYAIGYSYYITDDFRLYGAPRDRETRRESRSKMEVVSAMKFWQKSFGFGYVDAGLGIGIAKGVTHNNCKTDEFVVDGYTFQDDFCDFDPYTSVAFPLEANATLGKFLGLGLFTRVSLTAKGEHGYIVGLTIPIGLF